MKILANLIDAALVAVNLGCYVETHHWYNLSAAVFVGLFALYQRSGKQD